MWLTWWLGDVGGALVIAPALVLWARRPWPRWTRAQLVELAALAASIVAVGVIVFGGYAMPSDDERTLKFLCLPLHDLAGIPLRSTGDGDGGGAPLGRRRLGNGALPG